MRKACGLVEIDVAARPTPDHFEHGPGFAREKARFRGAEGPYKACAEYLHDLREQGCPSMSRLRNHSVLLDGLSKNRLARSRASQGVQEDPGRAGGGGGAGGGPDAPRAAGFLRPRAAVARRRGPRSHRRRTRGRARAARGEPGAGAGVGAVRIAVSNLLGGVGRERNACTSRMLLPAGLRFVREEGVSVSSVSGAWSRCCRAAGSASSTRRARHTRGDLCLGHLVLRR